jgi:hypothetical protein
MIGSPHEYENEQVTSSIGASMSIDRDEQEHGDEDVESDFCKCRHIRMELSLKQKNQQ